MAVTWQSLDRKGYGIHNLWISRQPIMRQCYYLKTIAMTRVKRQKLMFLLSTYWYVEKSKLFLSLCFFSCELPPSPIIQMQLVLAAWKQVTIYISS